MKSHLPNTFLIGVQKAATTSYFSWLSQHPDVLAPMEMKDYPFFGNPNFYDENYGKLQEYYSGNERVKIQGNVNYIFDKEALNRIKLFEQRTGQKLKFILILRDPVERAISAFNYFRKTQDEKSESLLEAIEKEESILSDNNLKNKYDLTYVEHGLYHKQLLNFFELFDKEQLHIILYEDVSNNPIEAYKNTLLFLKINSEFEPLFESKNITGKTRFPIVQKIVWSQNKYKRKFVSFFNRILPVEKRATLKNKIMELNTKSVDSANEDVKLKSELRTHFEEDLRKLVDIVPETRNW